MKLIIKEEKKTELSPGRKQVKVPRHLELWVEREIEVLRYIVALVIPPGVIGYIHNRQNANPASGKSLQTAWIWGIETTDPNRSRNLDIGLDKAMS